MNLPRPVSPAPATASAVAQRLLAALALAASGLALGEGNPYHVGVSQGLGHDSNLYRVDQGALPDKYSITGLLAGVDQPFGRQRFYANGAVRATRFEDVKELNNTSYQLNAGLDWATIERLSGNVNLALSEKLANYGSSINQPQLTKKNLESNEQFNLRAQLGLVSLLSLEASYAHRRLAYSAVEFDSSEVTQNAVAMGLKYRPGGALTLGAGLRYTRGEYPNVLLTNGDTAQFSRKDLDLTAQWQPSGLSSFNVRLSFGKQLSEALTQRDFSGTTGSVSWSFLPTGKLAFNTVLSRDTGTESSFASNGNGFSASGDNSTLTTSLGIQASYEATAKIKLNAGLRYSRRNLANELLITGLPAQTVEGTDTLKSLSLGATYVPTRSLQLGCNSARETRNASGGLSNSYSATTNFCSAQFTLQ